MIDIKIEDGIRINFNGVSKVIPDNEFPLKVIITKYINDDLCWETEVYDNWFAEYKSFNFNNLIIKTKSGIELINRKFDPSQSSELDMIFYMFCKSNPNQKGLTIGTHDGAYGEWVQSVKECVTDAVLVEASKTQFKSLKEHYSNNDNVLLINSLVTTDGGDVSFYESSVGYFNSTNIDHLKKYHIDDIKEVKKKSISIKKLILENFDGKPSWLHLDVEGLDAQLILSLKDDVNLLPDFIIFEFNNLSDNDRNDVVNFLNSNEYDLKEYGISMLAIKKNQ